MLNWTSMNAADLVLFNSQWHKDSWFRNVPGLLSGLPDHRHDGLVAPLANHAEVLPVGVDLRRFDPVEPRGNVGDPVVLWNHRWEHDKRPDLFAAAVLELADAGVGFSLALAGERFGKVPADLGRLRERLGDRIVFDADATGGDYADVLRMADIVVSTAEQENFGISVTEAVYAGACPVLPADQVYPERIPAELHPVCLYDVATGLAGPLRRLIEDRALRRDAAAQLMPVMAGFDWHVLGPVYDARLANLVSEHR